MPVQLGLASPPGPRLFTLCCQMVYGDHSSLPGCAEGLALVEKVPAEKKRSTGSQWQESPSLVAPYASYKG